MSSGRKFHSMLWWVQQYPRTQRLRIPNSRWADLYLAARRQHHKGESMASGNTLKVGDVLVCKERCCGDREVILVSGTDLVTCRAPSGAKYSDTEESWLASFEVTQSVRTTSPTGALRDNGNKPQLSYIPLDLCDGAARIMTFGAKKYARNNWRKGYPPIQNLDSLLRHLSQLQLAIEHEDKDGSKGFLFDPDHGESQASAVLVNIWFTINSMRLAGYKV